MLTDNQGKLVQDIVPEAPIPGIIDFRDSNEFTTFEVNVFLKDGSDATNYPVFYLATAPCFLMEARIRHEANSTSGVVDIEKLPSGTAKGSGGSMLTSKFSIAALATTVQRTGETTVLAGYQLVPGDAMALKATGTLTNAGAVTVGVLLGMNIKNIPTSQAISTVLVGFQ